MNDRILALDLGTSSVRGLVLDAAARPLPGALARRKVTVDRRRRRGRHDRPGRRTWPGSSSAWTSWPRPATSTASGWWPRPRSGTRCCRWAPDGGPVGARADLAGQPAGAEPGRAAAGPADPDGVPRPDRRLVARPLLDRAAAVAAGAARRRTRRGSSACPSSCWASCSTRRRCRCRRRPAPACSTCAPLDWDAEACALAGARPAELPTARAGRLAGPAACRRTPRRWPALRDAAWAAPVGDGAASNIGSGGVDASRAAVTVGTSAAVRLVQAAPAGAAAAAAAGGLWRYRVDHDRIVTGAAYSNGGNLYAWARRELRLPEGAALEEALATTGRPPPGSGPTRGWAVTARPGAPRPAPGRCAASASPPPRWTCWRP